MNPQRKLLRKVWFRCCCCHLHRTRDNSLIVRTNEKLIDRSVLNIILRRHRKKVSSTLSQSWCWIPKLCLNKQVTVVTVAIVEHAHQLVIIMWKICCVSCATYQRAVISARICPTHVVLLTHSCALGVVVPQKRCFLFHLSLENLYLARLTSLPFICQPLVLPFPVRECVCLSVCVSTVHRPLRNTLPPFGPDG